MNCSRKKINLDKLGFPQNCYKTHFISFCLLTFTLATLELISCLYSVHQPSQKHDRYIIRENLLRLIRLLTLLVDSILWNRIIIYFSSVINIKTYSMYIWMNIVILISSTFWKRSYISLVNLSRYIQLHSSPNIFHFLIINCTNPHL